MWTWKQVESHEPEGEPPVHLEAEGPCLLAREMGVWSGRAELGVRRFAVILEEEGQGDAGEPPVSDGLRVGGDIGPCAFSLGSLTCGSSFLKPQRWPLPCLHNVILRMECIQQSLLSLGEKR